MYCSGHIPTPDGDWASWLGWAGFHGLCLKPSKCTFFKQEVNYLGFVVSVHGVAMDPERISAIEWFPTPADLKSLPSFLGLVSYY